MSGSWSTRVPASAGTHNYGIPVLRPRAPHPLTKWLAEIVGCVLVDGACTTHQRPLDTPRPGCPFVDAMIRTAGGQP